MPHGRDPNLPGASRRSHQAQMVGDGRHEWSSWVLVQEGAHGYSWFGAEANLPERVCILAPIFEGNSLTVFSALYIPTSFRTVYALTGAIYKAYKNPIETELGFPVSQYQNLVGGKGHFVLFQHGYIQDHPNTGVNIVKKTSSNQPGLKFQSEGGTPTFGRVLQVTYSGQMHINDDENWPSSDEFADYTLPPSPQNLLSSFPSITFPIIDRCAGDEVRVTLHVTADRVTAPEIPEGAVTINGNAKLYEGASCNTDDLETEQSFNFLLLPGQNQARDINLIDSSGDAQIHLNFNVVVL